MFGGKAIGRGGLLLPVVVRGGGRTMTGLLGSITRSIVHSR